MMTTKIALWCLIDDVHRDYNQRHITYDQAMIYLSAYLKVAEVGAEKSRKDLTNRIEKVRKWITDQYKEERQ